MTLYQIFDEAVENDYVNKNPARKLSLPTNYTDGTHRSTTPFERKHILKVAEWHHAGLWVLTQLYCGLRPSETKNLMWCIIASLFSLFLSGYCRVSTSLSGDCRLKNRTKPTYLGTLSLNKKP